MDTLYAFVYRGLLTEESLDKTARRSIAKLTDAEAEKIRAALAYHQLDNERMVNAERMSLIYKAIHAFENEVRDFVKSAMAEKYEAEWWTKVPGKIRSKVQARMDEESRFRWHGSRGGSEIEYCDFGDMSSIIVTNWAVFEAVLVDMEWAKALLSILERSRNIVMHGGNLALQDIERIGLNIRDWMRQAG